MSALPHGFFSHGLAGFSSSSVAGAGISTTASSSNLQQVASLINDILGIAVSGIASAACFKLVADAYLSVQPNWRASISFGLKRLHSVLWVTLESTVIPFIPLIAVILGAIVIGSRSLLAGVIIGVVLGLFSLAIVVWLWVGWRFNVISLIVEGVKGRHALGRSLFLVQGRWWPTFGIQLLMQLIVGIIGGVISVPLGLGGIVILARGYTAAGLLLVMIGSVISNVLLMPLLASMLAVLYFDLRVRKEGLDLAIMARELEMGDIGGFAMAGVPGFAPKRAYAQYPYPQGVYTQQYPYPQQPGQQYPQYPYPQGNYPQQPYPQQQQYPHDPYQQGSYPPYQQSPDPQYSYPQYPQYPQQYSPEGVAQQAPTGYFNPLSDNPSSYLPPAPGSYPPPSGNYPPPAGSYPPPSGYPGQTIPNAPNTPQPPPTHEDTWPEQLPPSGHT